MNAADILTADVITVREDTPIQQIVTTLLARRISGVPVVNAEGAVVGLVSEGDLLRRAELGTQKRRGSWLTFFTGTATLATDYVRSHGETARDIMTRTVVWVSPGTSVSDIADLMEERRVKRVPVIDDGKLVGIVSRSNLLRALASTASAPGGESQVSDEDIRSALFAELSNQAWSKRSDNSVVVSDAVVHLWGLVTTREEQRALELAAKGVAGVRAVESHMIILSEEPYPLFPNSMVT